jgi:NAD(P)H-dependent FMN reductase
LLLKKALDSLSTTLNTTKGEQMRIAIMIGSVRVGRQSQKAALFLEKELKKRNHEVTLIDLATDPLPIMEERISRDEHPPASAVRISRQLKEAEAIILVTPEYHGSFSGVLKNALDYFLPEFAKKVVGVATATTGRFGGLNASVQLQHVVLSMGAFPLPQKLIVPDVPHAFDDEMNPTGELLGKQAQKFLDEFTWLAEAVTQAHQQKKELV